MAETYYKPCSEFDRCNELIEKYWNTKVRAAITMYSFPQCRGLAPLTGSITNPCKRRMRFSCGISSRSDFAKKFIEQFPPTKAQSTKIGCAFSLPAPYSEERRKAASEAAKQNSVNKL